MDETAQPVSQTREFFQQIMISSSAEVSVDTLYNLVDPKNPELLKELGGTSGLAEKLGSSIDSGLKTSDIERQVSKYGTNILPEQISKSFFAFVWEGLHDKTLMVLMVAAAVELAIGVYKTWFAPKKDSIALIDGGAILIAVVIVVMFGAVSDFRKQAQFKALSEFGKSLTLVKALRDGEWIEIHSNDVVVGDIIDIQTGDIAPADAVLVSGFNVACDESAMTGEPMSVNKDLINEPFIISGTNVVNGVGRILVIGTGINSLNGRSMLALEIESEETPLQQKLNVLADAIAKFAFYLAITMIVILGASYFIVNQGVTDGFKISSDLTVLLILAVTVVVVAVPEGLPLAVTLSLAHATIQMLKDNNLVRHLSACETMGNATTICSDKTGTLTLNKMTVVRASIMEKSYIREESKGFIENLTATPALKSVVSFIAKSMNVNCTAEESKGKDGNSTLRGSKTEIAILEFWNSYGFPFVKDRASTQVINIVPFSSDRKRMTTVVKLERNEILESTLKLDSASAERSEYVFVKGASEIVLKCCTRMVNSAGEIVPLTPDLMLAYNNLISEYASEALRTICCAFKPYKQTSSKAEDEEFVVDDDSDLILVTILGILDPLRDEVPAAVAKCQNAGVIVRMVTGDSAPTARAIAKGCGILSADGLVMEGPDFRKLTESELDVILPKLQVLARSSPVDKQILVRNLKRLGETVAVTGGL